MSPPPSSSLDAGVEGSLEGSLEASTPCVGHLLALRTKAEVRATFDLIPVYIVQVPLKSANTLLRWVIYMPSVLSQLLAK